MTHWKRRALSLITSIFLLLELLIFVSILIDFPFTGILRNPYMIGACAATTLILIVLMMVVPRMGIPVRWKRPRNSKGHGIYK